MSHEIRTPMNGIMGMTQIVLDGELNESQRECMGMVQSSSDSLLRIINDILDFSKIEAGHLDLEITEFNLIEILEESARALSAKADEKRLELICDLDRALPEKVLGDPTRLRQIVMNLIGNAIKFTQRGQIVLRASVDAISPEANMLHFVVSDTGIGIPEEKQKLVFNAFVQADTSTTRNFGGTGLGLSICSRLVELMSGRIWVESEPGLGSQFHFTASFGKSSTVCDSTTASQRDLSEFRVLIVDDNAASRRNLSELIAAWGLQAVEVEGALQAIEMLSLASSGTPIIHLVLSDADMPGMDGLALAAAMRQNRQLADIPLILLTSASRSGASSSPEQTGVADQLSKPVQRKALHRALAAALGVSVAAKRNSHRRLDSVPERALRILVAEDNAVNQQLARRMLEKRGHTVLAAWNGREALAILDTEQIDVVLMDVQMPELDGWEATAIIREKEKLTGRHQIIIAATANAMSGDENRCLQAGMDGYTTKPIQIQRFIEVVEAVRTSAMPVASV